MKNINLDYLINPFLGYQDIRIIENKDGSFHALVRIMPLIEVININIADGEEHYVRTPEST